MQGLSVSGDRPPSQQSTRVATRSRKPSAQLAALPEGAAAPQAPVLTAELKDQMRVFDTDGDGLIDFEEFKAAAMRMNKSFSKSALRKIFDSLDKDGSGKIEFTEFMGSQLMKWDYMAVAKGPQAALRTHLAHQNVGSKRIYGSQADRDRASKELWDDTVKKQEVSAELALQLAKSKLAGNKFCTGQMLFKAFKFYDADNSGSLTMDEFKHAFKELKIAVKESTVEELYRTFDSDGNGTISYEEFIRCLAPRSAQLSQLYRPNDKTIMG